VPKQKKKLDNKIQTFIKDKYYPNEYQGWNKVADKVLKTSGSLNTLFDEYLKIKKIKLSDVEQTKEILTKSFGSLENALKKINKIKTDDPTVKALQQIRNTQESFQRTMEKLEQNMLTKNSLTGAVRKQKFKRPELTNQIVQALKPKKDEKIVTEDLSNFLKNKNKTKPKEYVEILADGRKRTHLYYGYGKGDGSAGNFMDWLWDNKIGEPFGIVKHYKNKKTRYEPKSWEDATQILRSLNFTPKEALEYAIAKIQTKERFLEHRLYRQIEERNASGLEDFIKIYKEHLKTKLPFKSFFYSKELASWCASEDIFFNSEENCRVNKDLMVKAWNKKYPEDKIIDKKKK